MKKKKIVEMDVSVAYATVLKHLRTLTDSELDALSFLVDVEIKERNINVFFAEDIVKGDKK
jgi:hypothetical protein